jgi:cation diffusion facilitator family transporter
LENSTANQPATDRLLDESGKRDRRVSRVLWIEGGFNAAAVAAKAVVGISTGSAAVIGDAIHSLADLANNAVALVAMRLASQPPDSQHPYGHRKYESLAVFGAATLLSVLALEIALRAFDPASTSVSQAPWSLTLMLAVLSGNIALASWQAYWARRLESDILAADARHTLSDVLTTVAVIAGWQFAARGYRWLDTAMAIVVSALILTLAFGLFRRAIPILVDERAAAPEALTAVVNGVAGVKQTRRVRSRSGPSASADVVVSVDASISTTAAHEIANEIERVIRERFPISDVSVHIEPD